MSRRKQFAALPFVLCKGRTRICVITSRDTGRWIVPKGWPQKGLKPHKLAEREAFEEAGLVGSVDTQPAGHFHYLKQLDDGSQIECDVGVFPMLVRYQATDWPEKGQRATRWVGCKKAADLVDDDGLAAIIRGFAPSPQLAELAVHRR